MSKRLVAYFSASGVTAKVAENLADAIGADVFEIQPEVPYTKDDLNWIYKDIFNERRHHTCRKPSAIQKVFCLLCRCAHSSRHNALRGSSLSLAYPAPESQGRKCAARFLPQVGR